MKKIIFSISLLIALVACGKEESTTPLLYVSIKLIEVESVGGTKDVSITSNTKWTAASGANDWCKISPTSGDKNGSIKVEISENLSLSPRETKITLKSETLEKTIDVMQDPASKQELLSGSKWELIMQKGESGYDDLVGTIIDLKKDMKAIATMNLEIEEGVFLDKVEGTWSMNGEIIVIKGDFIGTPAEITFEIKEMTDSNMSCVMKINLPLLPPDGLPVVFKKV